VSVALFLTVALGTALSLLGAGAITGWLIAVWLNERDERAAAHHEPCTTATAVPQPWSSSTRSWP
jgi:hypothetical protein